MPWTHALVFQLAVFFVAGCEGEDPAPVSNDGSTSLVDGGSQDGGMSAPDAGTCEERSQVFEQFLADHQDCNEDTECTSIGDCGPNADFAAVRLDAAEVASGLQQARCASTYDGLTYGAVCVENKCVLDDVPDGCCGCAPSDSGPDAELMF